MARYELNDSVNGIEIYFDGVPAVDIREEMKASGFRWHNTKKCWYAKKTDERLELTK